MLKLQVLSVYYREHLVVEIMDETSTMIAEINREDGPPRIEFYVKEGQSFDLAEFLEILERGKEEIANT